MLEKTFKIIKSTTEPNDIKLYWQFMWDQISTEVSTTLILIELIS